MDYRKLVADNLKHWRAVRGLTQRELAQRAGVGYASVARIETGRQDPTVGLLGRLGEALDVDVVDLLMGPQEESRPVRKWAGRKP